MWRSILWSCVTKPRNLKCRYKSYRETHCLLHRSWGWGSFVPPTRLYPQRRNKRHEHCSTFDATPHSPNIFPSLKTGTASSTRITTYQSLRIQLTQNAPDDGPMRSETCRANKKCWIKLTHLNTLFILLDCIYILQYDTRSLQCQHILYSLFFFRNFSRLYTRKKYAIVLLNYLVISKPPLTGESFISQLKSEHSNNWAPHAYVY